jgi:hypothetical protein
MVGVCSTHVREAKCLPSCRAAHSYSKDTLEARQIVLGDVMWTGDVQQSAVLNVLALNCVMRAAAEGGS